jgi:hypothetical protein
MNRRFFLTISMSAPILWCLPVSPARAQGPGHKSITTASGKPVSAGTHGLGDTGPFSLKITKRPSNGVVKIESRGAGVQRVMYTSRKGFVGKDEFAYVRVGGTPRFAGTYTVSVTVK